MISMDDKVLSSFPEFAINRLTLLRSLPIEENRNSIISSLSRLVNMGLVCRVEHGVYALTERGIQAKQGVLARLHSGAEAMLIPTRHRELLPAQR